MEFSLLLEVAPAWVCAEPPSAGRAGLVVSQFLGRKGGREGGISVPAGLHAVTHPGAAPSLGREDPPVPHLKRCMKVGELGSV